LSNPNVGETMTLERYMGREMRARYLNPKWIEAMLNEGYSGARMIRQVTDNLWGWQVTVPDAVGDAKWQEMFETYVQDRHALGIREKFKAAENLAAYKAMVDRMLTVIEKGYWQASPETVARLKQVQTELVPAVAAENAAVAKRAEAIASATPAAKLTPIVRGRVLEEKPRAETTSHAHGGKVSSISLSAGLAVLVLIAFGWWREGVRSHRMKH
jgi:cobaltochelatase CobN